MVCFVLIALLVAEFIICVNVPTQQAFIKHCDEPGTMLGVVDVKRNKTLPPPLSKQLTLIPWNVSAGIQCYRSCSEVLWEDGVHSSQRSQRSLDSKDNIWSRLRKKGVQQLGKAREGILDKGSMVKHPKMFSLILGVAAEPTAWFRSRVSLTLSNGPK